MLRRLFLSGNKGLLFILMLMTLLSACVSMDDTRRIPIVEPIPKSGLHKVVAKETLYSIATQYGLNYRKLANLNHIKPPYTIHKGQIIRLKMTMTHPPQFKKYAPHSASKKMVRPTPPPVKISPKKTEITKNPVPIKKIAVAKVSYGRVTSWLWPAHGPVQSSFSALNKGIDISGKVGDPIYAAASGKVVYCGNGLRRYGNLIILKHNNTFLTAYAHNNKLFVHEGDWVNSGQKIAEMGLTDTKLAQLPFEIRRNGQPVNPLPYLAKKN